MPSLSMHSSCPLSTLFNFSHFNFYFIITVICSLFFILVAKAYFTTPCGKTFLLDFSCYKPDDSLKCAHKIFIERSALIGTFSEESLLFQKTILEKSGLGDSTYVPKAMWSSPPNLCMVEARNEVETVIFGAVDQVLAKTGIKNHEIGIVIVNSSVFNPSPSLCSLIINQYKLKSSVLSYNLGGMGCSAGLISVDLAKHLLQVRPNTVALVVSTENITFSGYVGNHRSMLIPNCLFRMGASAVLLSNRLSDRNRSKYNLIHTIRIHNGNKDIAYKCAYQEEDNDGKIGVALSKDLSIVAGEALGTNLSSLGPLVLPTFEQLKFFGNLIGRKLFRKKIRTYIPDFKQAFQHFCIHAGGKTVLDKVEKGLGLNEKYLEPSRMTLYRFGNTSSSSLWYELAYLEAKGKIKEDDHVCQIAFGSGFKCNSAVWRALRAVDPADEKKNPWIDEIDKYPIRIQQ